MSDTPRTDAAEKEFRVYDGYHNLHGMAEFSRQLERENADLRAQLAAKEKEIEAMRPVMEKVSILANTVEDRNKYDDLAEEEAALEVVLAFREYESNLSKG